MLFGGRQLLQGKCYLDDENPVGQHRIIHIMISKQKANPKSELYKIV
jgi:hypothetical protein